jgi:hypothetical protein
MDRLLGRWDTMGVLAIDLCLGMAYKLNISWRDVILNHHRGVFQSVLRGRE